MHLYGEANALKYPVNGDMRMRALIAGVNESYKKDPHNELKIWEWSCGGGKKQWRKFAGLMRRAYERGRDRLRGHAGGRYSWAGEYAEGGLGNAHSIPGIHMSTAEARLKEDFFLFLEIDSFVESRFAAGQETAVLVHIRALWSRVSDAIEEVADTCNNTVILRVYTVILEFVESGFVGRLRDLHKTTLFGGCTVRAQPVEDDLDDELSMREHNQHGADEVDGAPKQKKHTHKLNLKGEPYLNLNGHPYTGSVCDWCEKEGHSFHHHPRQCGRCFPQWQTSPPGPGAKVYTRK
jgi:hypothetical protein